jgi:outer membrane protein assembly factor BamA
LITRSPVRLGVGGLGPGAGLAAGTEFEWSNSSDQIAQKLWGSVSVNLFYSAGTGLEFRHITPKDLSFSINGSYSNSPQINYYGSGPNSLKSNRTDFLREDTLFEFRQALRGYRHLEQTCGIGELLLNVGPGTDSSLASTEQVFTPAEAPGVDHQSNYFLAGCGAGLDFRDFKGDPHKGTYAAAAYVRYHAQEIPQFSFHRVSAVAEQYIPFWNEKRVIALRALTELSYHSDDQVVPFYMQATLGSDVTLRGFRRYRFYDENSLALTGEYRWEISNALDMAVFTDFGKVFHRPGEISFSNMEVSPGFGFRFKGRRNVLARLDTGFSHEGFQVWLRFDGLFH